MLRHIVCRSTNSFNMMRTTMHRELCVFSRQKMTQIRTFAQGSPNEIFIHEDPLPTKSPGGPTFAPFTIRSGNHVLRGDLMPAAGGSNQGPAAKELAYVSVGLCTAMTVRIYAERSGIPLEHVECKVKAVYGDQNKHVPQKLELELALVGSKLTTEHRERLLRAASKCPVKQMFLGQMTGGIESKLVDAVQFPVSEL